MSQYFRLLIVAGLALGAVLTTLGLLASWLPTLDLVNNGLPVTAAGALLLLGLALATKDRRLILPAAFIATINAVLVFAAWQGAAPQAASGSERFLRVVTLNLLYRNDRMDDAAKFLAETNADVVVLQEATGTHADELRRDLGSLYPHSVGDFGLVILSKHPILADGRIDRSGYPDWISLMARWVRLEVQGTQFELAGVHLARPFYPVLQQHDIATLTQFVRGRTLPLIVAGDFNMTPWTEQLKGFTQATGLQRYNTFHLTWPMRWRKYPVMPLVAIDNVFTSSQFAKIATRGGPRLGSDHRPIIADIALAAPVHSGVE